MSDAPEPIEKSLFEAPPMAEQERMVEAVLFASAEPVTLAEIRAHLRLDTTGGTHPDDGYLQALIAAARGGSTWREATGCAAAATRPRCRRNAGQRHAHGRTSRSRSYSGRPG